MISFNFSIWNKKNLFNTGVFAKQVDKAYQKAINRIGAAAGAYAYMVKDTEKPLSLDKYVVLHVAVDKILADLRNEILTITTNAIRSGFNLANEKNDALANEFLKGFKVTPEQTAKYFSRNESALEFILKRKTHGLSLSDRVWKYTGQFKQEIEMTLDLGFRSGQSAAEISRDLRKYLQRPDMLFRRVRDQHGHLHLSNKAKAYHPGQGVYRSSYKNAVRLAANESNISFKISDYERRQKIDFIVGVEVRLSNNHTLNGVEFTDMCDHLKGKYPKSFLFLPWHPACRCMAIDILKTEKEFIAGTTESSNTVTDVPNNFKKWIMDNQDRIKQAEKKGTLPYFIEANKSYIKM